MDKCSKYWLAYGGTGILVAALGIVMSSCADYMFEYIVDSQLVLSNTSGSFPMWQDIPAPIKTSMYLFNVTNPDEFLAGHKPHLVEVGPFVFDEYHTKVALQWNDENDTVTYKQVRTFQWNPSESAGPLTDHFTILNVPAATVGTTTKFLPSSTKGLVNFGLKVINEKLFVAKSAKEIFFDGYEDPLLNAAEFIHKFNIPMPGLTDKFGFYYLRNGSEWWDGVFNMYTGASDPKKLGQVATWNFTEGSPYFPSPCGKAEGAGDFFPPGTRGPHIELYSNDLCRPIVMNYTKKGSVKGISGGEYRIMPTYFGNSKLNKANWCFENSENGPVPSGVYSASACRFGAPIYMSQPHFYQADQYYLDMVSNGSLSPKSDKHETVFTVESQSGIPISVKARFQVNVLLDQIPEYDMFKHIQKRTYFPVVWFESKFELADFLVTKMWLLSHLRSIVVFGGLITVGVGILSVILAGVFLYRRRGELDQDDLQEPFIQNDTLVNEENEEK